MIWPILLDRVRAETRNRRFSYRTGQTKNPRIGILVRNHAHPGTLLRAIEKAVRLGGISKPVSTHALRHFSISASETTTKIGGESAARTHPFPRAMK